MSRRPQITPLEIETFSTPVLDQAGEAPQALRRKVFDRVRRASCGERSSEILPRQIATFCDAMLTDPESADIEGLLAGGYSEDQVFELTLAAAVGAGEARRGAGRRAMQQAQANVASRTGGSRRENDKQ